MKAKKKKMKLGGFFALDDRKRKLEEFTTPTDKLKTAIPWEIFTPILENVVPRKDRSKGGRPPYDLLLLFKILVLQTYYGLSDDKTEFEILDRMSFQKFLNLEVEDDVPDSKTIWKFKEDLGEKGTRALFDEFDRQLEQAGIIATKCVMVDASFVDAPRQRNTREENKRIKAGQGAPEDWKEAKKRQKDTDARWAKKNNETHFGYKNHVKAEKQSKLIEDYKVTEASRHDSQVLEDLVDEKDECLYADSAYKSEEHDELLSRHGIENQVHEKGKRNAPLTEEQKQRNREKSRTRVRVEHIFGFMSGTMKADRIRTIGRKRAERQVGLINLVYNMARTVQLGQSLA